MNWFSPIFIFICIWNQLSLIEWYWRIQHSIQMPKCERTIDITNNYNYQESKHIRFDSMIIIKLINPWIVNHWLTIKQIFDRLMDWLNGESNLISIPGQSVSIHSSFISVIIQFSSMFSMQWSIPIQWGKINILFQYLWLYCIFYLLNNGFTNVNNHHQISIHSNHSIVSLSNPIFLIIRSNQIAINIEQILVQTIIWVWLVDWNHCHLWMFNMWSMGHW